MRDFAQVDVFGARAFKGNPVAVIIDGQNLSQQEMQEIARWTNLSETTFILPSTTPEADYRLRIFTPTTELPFAGHPTLGSAHAWAAHTGSTAKTIVQECGAGLVHVRAITGGFAFAAPPTVRTGPLAADELAAYVQALGINSDAVVDHQWVDNGPGFAAIQLASAAEVRALNPDFSNLPDAALGVIGAMEPEQESAFEIRSFVPSVGVLEDPVTGSLNAGVAQWFARTGKASGSYLVSQGGNIGYEGQLHIDITQDNVWIGGATRTMISGVITI